MPIKQDLGAVQEGLEQGVKVILNQLIDGTITELNGPIREIAARLTIAARRKRQDLVDECADQLVLIVLEKKLRIRASASGIFDHIIALALNALVNGAIAGLTGLKAV